MTTPDDFPKPTIRPTAQVEPFVRVLGLALAVTFLMSYGGADLRFPLYPKAGHPLVEMLGRKNVAALAATRLQPRIPLAKPWLARDFAARGESAGEIARKLKATDATVRKWQAAPDDKGAPPRPTQALAKTRSLSCRPATAAP